MMLPMQIKYMLNDIKFHVEVKFDNDKMFTASFLEIDDLCIKAKSEQEIVNQLVDKLKEYSKKYLEKYWGYSKDLKREHLPYVLKALLENEDTLLIILK